MSEESRRTDPKDPQVEAALGEFLERVNQGDPVDPEEFLAQHTLIADELRSTITGKVNAPKLAEAEVPSDDVNDSTMSFNAQAQETIPPRSVAKRDSAAETGGSGLPAQFGRYRIIRALGKGGMGTVYLAVDTQIERQVALKTPHFTDDPTGEQMQRFFREARAAGNLRHPNICPIYDFGQIDGKHFITMAYIEGHSLSAFIQPDKPQSERQILIVIRKLALALQAAHDKGIVHRDLKPTNIMIDISGEPIIMDFGLARQALAGDDIRLTQTGNILGTPAFMSPEQVEGQPDGIGSATDQYSLGVMLYELLTGQLPFQGSVMAVMAQILTKEPPRPSQLRAELDPRVETVCLKMMAKTPAERFASLKAVVDELTNILRSPASKVASQVKPDDQRARGKTAIGVLEQFRRPLTGGGWIPWSVLALGLAVCAVMAAFIINFPAKTAVVSPTAGGQPLPLPMKPAQEQEAPAALPPTFKDTLGMEFVLVPKGKSWLGGVGGVPGDKEVVMAQDFYLGKYEVTQEQWEKVTGQRPSRFSHTGGGKDLVKGIADVELKSFPVENVTWDDAQAFLDRLNKMEKVAGWVYRLPSESEWEYACRGGPLSEKSESAYDFYFDKPTNQVLPEQSNCWHPKCLERTCKVGSYQPNRLGLYDMHGNVWEWCEDAAPTAKGDSNRIPRGGCWSTNPMACTASYRRGPAHSEGRVGLRVARVPESKISR